jgi:YggT family protein
MTQALYYIIQSIGQLLLLLLLLRFWLPWFRADFRNPIAQGILRLTSPIIIPVRRLLPSVGRLDTATILVAYVLQFLLITALVALQGRLFDAVPIAIVAAIELVILSLNLFFFVILIRIILGWFAPATHNPLTMMLHSLAEPILAPFRRWVPPMGGIDISPIMPIILIGALVRGLQSYIPMFL